MNKIRNKFNLKLGIIISLLIISVVSGISFTLLRNVKKEFENQLVQHSNMAAHLIISYSLEPVVMENYSTLYDILENIKSAPNNDIKEAAIINPAGIVMTSTDKEKIGDKINLPTDNFKNTISNFRQGSLEVISPIRAYANNWGYLSFSYSLSNLEKLIFSFRYQLMLLSIIYIVIGLVISLFITRKIVKPINQLVDHAKMIADGNLLEPVKISSKDEFSILAQTMEEMRINLKFFISKVAKKAISYEGELEIFGLPTLLNLFHATEHTGGLVLKQENKLGIIYFKDGAIYDAILDSEKGLKAVYHFFAWKKGYFKFNPELSSKTKRISSSFKELILTSARQVQNLSLFRHEFPTKEIILKPVTVEIKRLLNELPFNQDEEKLLNNIKDDISIEELLGKLSWSEDKLYEILYRLNALGLINTEENEENMEETNNVIELAEFNSKIHYLQEKREEG